MFQANMPKFFWNHALSHTLFLINRIPTKDLNYMAPHQIVFQELPDISTLKVFGCLCFAATLSTPRGKLDPQARKCVHLGFKHGTKGYLLFDINSKQIFLSRDVTFYESVFPFATTLSLVPSTSLLALTLPNIEDIDDSFPIHPPTDTEPLTNQQDPSTALSPAPQPRRKSTRTILFPIYLKDFHHSLLSYSSLPPLSTKYPLAHYIFYDHLTPYHKNFVLNMSLESEPTTYNQAIKNPYWK